MLCIWMCKRNACNSEARSERRKGAVLITSSHTVAESESALHLFQLLTYVYGAARYRRTMAGLYLPPLNLKCSKPAEKTSAGTWIAPGPFSRLTFIRSRSYEHWPGRLVNIRCTRNLWMVAFLSPRLRPRIFYHSDTHTYVDSDKHTPLYFIKQKRKINKTKQVFFYSYGPMKCVIEPALTHITSALQTLQIAYCLNLIQISYISE